MFSSKVAQGVEVEHDGGDGEQRGVKAVKHAAMSGEHGAAVLDAQLSFQQTFHEVAPRAKQTDDDSHADPLPQTEEVGEETAEHACHGQTNHAAPDAADPRFFG